MAERRMFAKTIIDSDAFLDMPMSTQCLYFHLCMRADDEGFINNPKKIQRMIGATEDDLKLLIAKRFIIPFESGIVVIKHWRIHNYIRADRLVETKYQSERDMLTIKDNGAYTMADSVPLVEQIDANDTPASDKRKQAYENSTLPYSFSYKITRAFSGKPCPVCGFNMNGELRKPSVQHNIPISKGGEHEIDNISVICHNCNVSIRDKVTESLNNAEVIEMWDKIIYADRNNIKWFQNPDVLTTLDVRQMTDTCPSDVSIGKDSIGKDSIGKGKKFTPPTMEEVQAYCDERGNCVDAERFIDYYEARGWKLKNGTMKDWKAAVRTWENNGYSQKKQQQMSQIDYLKSQMGGGT